MTLGICSWQFSQTAQPQGLPVPGVDPAVSKLWLALEFCVCLAIETLLWRLDQWLILSFSVRSSLHFKMSNWGAPKIEIIQGTPKFWRLSSVLLRILKGNIFSPPILRIEFTVCSDLLTSSWKQFGNQGVGPGQHWGDGCFESARRKTM